LLANIDPQIPGDATATLTAGGYDVASNPWTSRIAKVSRILAHKRQGSDA